MHRLLDFIAEWWGLLIFVGAIILIYAVVAVVLTYNWAPTSPRCPEDAILLGGGQYQEGYWDYLYCGPAQ